MTAPRIRPNIDTYWMSTRVSRVNEYYSGLDVNVYFDDKLIPDVVNIQYQVAQEVLPIYNYASRHVQVFAYGNVFVQGSFSVNVSDADDVARIIKELNTPRMADVPDNPKLYDAASAMRERAWGKAAEIDGMQTLVYPPLGTSGDTTTAPVSPEDIMLYKNRYWNAFPDDEGNLDVEEVGAFEGGRTGFVISIEFRKKFVDDHTLIHLYNDAASMEVGDNDLPYRELTDLERATSLRYYASPRSTIIGRIIKDVHITGVGEAIDDSGRNILTVYSFVAKQLDVMIPTELREAETI